MSDRAAFSTMRVKCANKDCADFGKDRIIELPHLGDSVFLMPTVPGPVLGLPTLNLLCGTCAKDEIVEAA